MNTALEFPNCDKPSICKMAWNIMREVTTAKRIGDVLPKHGELTGESFLLIKPDATEIYIWSGDAWLKLIFVLK